MGNKWPIAARLKQVLEKEQGAVFKDWGGKLAVALAYPNYYYLAMSSLGFQTVYNLLNQAPDVVCERVFYGLAGLSVRDSSAFSLESQRPIDEFSVLAFSLSFEIDYLNAIDMLRALGIPPASVVRDETFPLLIGGGPAVTANPLPLSAILDAIVIGEFEPIATELTQALSATAVGGREATLQALAAVPGTYVPRIHGPLHDIPHPIRRQWLADLDRFPTHSVVLTPDTEFGAMYLIEIGRGCVRRCPFCLAGHCYKPHRERSPAGILEQAQEGLRYRQKIGLVSAAVSDYSQIDELVEALEEMGARLSVSSLRVRPLSETLVHALAHSGEQTLTIAPEAGSQRLRNLVQKGVSEADLYHAAELAEKYNFRQLKLYFVIGLPGETEDDVRAIVDLVRRLERYFTRQIIVNVTPFVPKAHTAFEREAMLPRKDVESRLGLLQREFRARGIAVKADSPRWAEVQGILSRGDRSLSFALQDLSAPTLKAWSDMLRAHDIDAQAYLGELPPDERPAWSQIVI